MSYIEFSTEKNSISIIKTSPSSRENLVIKPTEIKGVSIYEKEKEFCGVAVESFLTDIELKSVKSESYFKSLLENNNIPFLYVGQGPTGVEYSETLNKKLKSHRPDFLVNFPDIGSLFFDVKCRYKIGFSNSNRYFYLFRDEADSLINLHEKLLIPVWLAFYDSESVDTKPEKIHLMPISLFKQLRDALRQRLTEREYKFFSVFRIPEDLLTPIVDKFVFQVGHSVISESLMAKTSNNYKGLFRRIEDEVRGAIRKGKVLKSKLSDKLIAESLSFVIRPEIDNVVAVLIDEGTVIYEPRKPLGLLGEE